MAEHREALRTDSRPHQEVIVHKTFMRSLGVSLLCVGIGYLLVLVTVSSVTTAQLAKEIRQSQVHNSPKIDNSLKAARAARRGTHLIRDCVTPQGKCYQRGKHQTGAAVNRLTEVVIYAASCASELAPATPAVVRRCIEDELAAR